MGEPLPLERAILRTISYFDLFSYPLTQLELWKWLYIEPGQQAATFSDVLDALESSDALQAQLEVAEGMYFLRGREAIVASRKERYLLAERKYRRVLRTLRVLRCVPFIRAVAVCNSLAYSNTREDGDLDILIITEPGKIWTTRMFATGLAKLFGWRPTAQHARDGLCLSFFLNRSTLDLLPVSLTPDDPYLRYWVDHLVPVMGRVEAIDALRSENAWVRDRLPNTFGVVTAPRRILSDSFLARALRTMLAAPHRGWFGYRLEHAYRLFQKRQLPEGLRRLANKDSRVVMNDSMLKFHENDRRAQFSQEFSARVGEAA